MFPFEQEPTWFATSTGKAANNGINTQITFLYLALETGGLLLQETGDLITL